LGIGYSMHLTGFTGWLTLVIAGASLFTAGALWGDIRRFASLASGVAVVGAALCLSALPVQLHANATGAAVMNFGVIFCQLAAFILIVHNITSSREMPLHRI
jgi:hypothetical protein